MGTVAGMHGIDDAGGRAGSARRAELIARAGSLAAALADGSLPLRQTITLSEAVVLGLLAQDVRTYLTVLGHGSTDIGEMLRIYGAAGLLRTVPMHHETAAAHAASALRWTTGEKAAVVTSIGPGALQAMAGSLVSASDGLGVWHLYGDETTEDEGPNMQQIPKHEQGLFLRLCSTMGHAYSLHTPAAVGPALRRGGNVVDHPYRPGPFYLLLPLNTQPSELVDFNLHELPVGPPPAIGPANDRAGFRAACDQIRRARQVVVRVGGGATGMTAELIELLDAVDGVAVIAPRATGAVPYGHPRVAGVGGTKGSIAGNFVMEHADLLISIGSRSVCQSDCSRTGYPNVRHVININADVDAAMHYNETTALVGDARTTTAELVAALRASGDLTDGAQRSEWLERCAAAKQEWAAFKQARYDHPRLHDPVWSSEVLTQPAAIKIATDWARSIDARVFFDAGDVQANGFQIVEDDAPVGCSPRRERAIWVSPRRPSWRGRSPVSPFTVSRSPATGRS